MDEINQLKAIAFQKLAESGILPRDNLQKIHPEDREKFERFWDSFERNVGVCVENMSADQSALRQGLNPDLPSKTLLRCVLSFSAGIILLCIRGVLGWGGFLAALVLFLTGFFFPRG